MYNLLDGFRINEENGMNPQHLITRTKLLAVGVFNMVKDLPKVYTSQTMANQIIRAATSVGANYRAACKSKSAKDFIYKLKVVEEELDETIYWLELIWETHIYMGEKIVGLLGEAKELILIVRKSGRTARSNQKKKQNQLP